MGGGPGEDCKDRATRKALRISPNREDESKGWISVCQADNGDVGARAKREAPLGEWVPKFRAFVALDRGKCGGKGFW